MGQTHLQVVTLFYIEVQPVFQLLQARAIFQELLPLPKSFQPVGFPRKKQANTGLKSPPKPRKGRVLASDGMQGSKGCLVEASPVMIVLMDSKDAARVQLGAEEV